ncbi:MAG: 4Fe-4S binding protein, partial [Spirochaetales bacterium]|nr:4Fe-4S binding protein [Spirochaetales bacterium]
RSEDPMISVYTAGELCKKCYSCVRECPTKAIEVHGGQAHIIEEKCISCGRCVLVCSQNAKRIRSSVEEVLALLNGSPGNRVYAMLAPSFPAAFLELRPGQVVGALRAAGFDGVFEVAFGADLVSYAYYRRFQELLGPDAAGFIISSPCPAVVSYVEKMYPELVPYLAELMSPMEAMATVIRQKMDPEARIVFIGPCVAKKDEAGRLGLVDQVLTFEELRELLGARGVDPTSVPESPFDGPQANLGRIYPVTGGLLKAAAIDADLADSPVYVVEGPGRVTEILTVLSNRLKNGLPVVNRLFDLLLCEGCIGGPVMVNSLSFYERRKYVVQYMKSRPLIHDIHEWAGGHGEYLDLDLSKSFHAVEQEEILPPEEEIRRILAMTNKLRPEDELNCRACGYASCRDKAIAVYRGIAEVEMCLPYLISKLEHAIDDLKDNQARLIQAEKLASMGQMAAGIAHEINNPLGVVLMFSHLLKDSLQEDDPGQKDVDKIIQEAERTRKIVRGILNFAREEKVERTLTDINQLLREAAAGVAGLDAGGRIAIDFQLDEALAPQPVDRSQLRQVFDNLLKNAVEVMPGGGAITIRSSGAAGDGRVAGGDGSFTVEIADSGPGIPAELLPKLFSPFVTSKPVGKGTGLGLAVCYGIVKMHGGSIQAVNRPEGGASFTIKIKQYAKEEAVGQNTHRR